MFVLLALVPSSRQASVPVSVHRVPLGSRKRQLMMTKGALVLPAGLTIVASAQMTVPLHLAALVRLELQSRLQKLLRVALAFIALQVCKSVAHFYK